MTNESIQLRSPRIMDIKTCAKVRAMARRQCLEVSTLESMPPEILTQILLELSVEQLNQICQVSSKLAEFCNDGAFWATKATHDFKFPRNLFFEDPKKRYLQIQAYHQNPNLTLQAAASQGNLALIDYAVSIGGKVNTGWDQGDHNILTLIQEGRINLPTMKYLVERGLIDPTYWQIFVVYAIGSGQVDIVMYLIEVFQQRNIDPLTTDILSFAIHKPAILRSLVPLLPDKTRQTILNDLLVQAMKRCCDEAVNYLSSQGAV